MTHFFIPNISSVTSNIFTVISNEVRDLYAKKAPAEAEALDKTLR